MFSFKEHAVGYQSPEQTLLILAYETAKVEQCALDAAIKGELGYKAAQLTEIADSISMLRYYCEMQSIDYEGPNSIIKDGDLRLWDASKQLEARVHVAAGTLIQSHHYNNIFGSTRYHHTVEVSMANLRELLRALCFERGHYYIDIATIGEEHYLERMEDIRQHGITSS